MKKNNIRLFVYGSMKKDFSNHGRLEKQKFLDNVTTQEKFVLYPHESYRFPCVYLDEAYDNIKGELYEIDVDTFKEIDVYEGYPNFYNRKIINVVNDLGKSVEAYIYYYILPKDNVDIDGKCNFWEKEMEEAAGIVSALKEAFKQNFYFQIRLAYL